MDSHSSGSHPTGPPIFAMDDEEIFQNIDGRMHGPMSGFIDKYFGSFEHTYQGSTLKIRKARRICGRYTVPSTAPLPDSFLPWFVDLASCETANARGSWHISSDNNAPEQESALGYGVRFCLNMPTSSASCELRWDCVQVIGQFYRNDTVPYQDGLVHLCRSAHKVFISQPTRLFLHGLYMRGPLIELWVFDRSGIFCSNAFDIRNDFAKFLPLGLSYQHMTDQDLGISDVITTNDDGNYILLDCTTNSFPRKLYIEDYPIASRQGLVGTGTTCYRAKVPGSNDWNCALKFKWKWTQERPENELLNLAKQKCVWGAVSLHYYKELDNTANLRRGLRWGVQRKFVTTPIGGRHEHIDENPPEPNCDGNGLVQFTEETNNFFQNRILTCTITSPLGRPLSTFHSLAELLQVLRDAIKCHQSLLYDAKVLHCDISPGNIIIVDHQDRDQPQGVLIDLDSAIEHNEELEAGLGITGTRPFMAIGVLRNEYHTYRHDLESFLYVLLWTIITNHSESPPMGSKLQQWSNGDWNELAARKSLDMANKNFKDILGEFGAEFHSLKPLTEKLRRLLFPLREGVAWSGTDDTPEAASTLYEGMIAAFEEALASEARTSI